MALGTTHDAWLAWVVTHGGYCTCGCDNDFDAIGHGESRAVYLIHGVVYKVADRPKVNIREHEALTEWRDAGATWAPSTTLYQWTDDVYGPEAVIAMPYLPDDGGDIDPATLAEIKAAAPQTCRENYTSHGGRTYLIDGGDIERPPATEVR